ncbi:hypothetical protein AC579_5089 [Pseudocercospora musae]|uniref:Thioredoxin domain-containing protein n=1 Tax=Pseudocercospora musae TaxID=113226 RepID=A0A139INA5_9PEZI|nr:hypothetical protein AC579_5089 [Pseudocercospora musae]
MPFTYFDGQDIGGMQTLPIPQDGALYLVFISSNDPHTKQPWCPDVRLALPSLETTFIHNDLLAIFVLVGLPEAWRDANNPWRKDPWRIINIPTVARYERNPAGEVKEVGRLIEKNILDGRRLQQLVWRKNDQGIYANDQGV